MPETPAALRDEFGEKLQQLGALASAEGVSTVVLRRQSSLSWLFGARSHVPYTLDRAWFDAVADFSTSQPQVTVVTNTIEAKRLQDTELADFPLQWQVIGWWEDRTKALPQGSAVGSDDPVGQMRNLAGPVASLRRALTPGQVGLLEDVCRESALIGTAVAALVVPTMTESHVAGLITAALMERQMDPVTVLVAGGDRVRTHRHPLPTYRPLGDRATLVFCGRRHGLISAVTRIVSFRSLTQQERDTYSKLLEVEAAFLDASVPGVTIGEAFARGAAAYADEGFDPDEWTRHHQGGFSGWESREYPASQASDDPIVERSVVAWNPSADGFKVEDTAVVTARGPRTLVHDPFWPMVSVAGRQRPGIVEV